MNMKHEAELTTHIVCQLNFEFIYMFSEAMSKLASKSKPKPYLPMHLYTFSMLLLCSTFFMQHFFKVRSYGDGGPQDFSVISVPVA